MIKVISEMSFLKKKAVTTTKSKIKRQQKADSLHALKAIATQYLRTTNLITDKKQ